LDIEPTDMNTITTTRTTALLLTGLGFAALSGGLAAGLAGCSSDPNKVSYQAISHNLTPELQGTVERPVDADRHARTTANLNLRMASDDFGRILYTDHPSKLSPMPIVQSSGMPR
jgi:hypothetical protein